MKQHTKTPPYPEISDKVYKKHIGEDFVALDGKILAFGSNSYDAYKKAEKKYPNIANKDILIGRIDPEIRVA